MPQRTMTAAKPIIGRSTSFATLVRVSLLIEDIVGGLPSTLQTLDREALGVRLRILRIERGAVEERLGLVVAAAVDDTELLHRFLVDVGAEHLFDDPFVVRLAGGHAPAPELREPPRAV